MPSRAPLTANKSYTITAAASKERAAQGRLRLLDSGPANDQGGLDAAGEFAQRVLARAGECIAYVPFRASRRKCRRKQIGNVVLVTDHQDADRHTAPPITRRGRWIVNSVNLPTSLSTAIVPPCCWVTMSQAIESPSPVPSPVGLV